MDAQLEIYDENTNPLDSVEDVMLSHNWTFDRMTEDELVVEVVGKTGKYRLFFIWQKDMNALQFCAQLELEIIKNNIETAKSALASINESMWMGHFDIPANTKKPSYRYTSLFRGSARNNTTETVEDIVDISLAQCERHYPLFTLLAGANDINEQTLSLAVMDTLGES